MACRHDAGTHQNTHGQEVVVALLPLVQLQLAWLGLDRSGALEPREGGRWARCADDFNKDSLAAIHLTDLRGAHELRRLAGRLLLGRWKEN